MLTTTKSGSKAKQITITGGGRWRFCNNFPSIDQAKAGEAIHQAKGRKTRLTEEVTSKTQAIKHAARGHIIPVGQVFYRLEAYIVETRQVMVHASAAECEAAGATPGACNL